MVLRANARSAGLVIQGGLGLIRGIQSMTPPAAGTTSEEITFELACTQNSDGTVTGSYHHTVDNGRHYGQVSGEIAYV
eukprot:6355574-Heterocapsa_arctica.AAC.1